MSRLEKTIGFLVFLLLLLGLFIGYFFWQQSHLNQQLNITASNQAAQQAQVSIIARDFGGQTALIAYGMTQQQVTAWQPDAVLVRGQAVWPVVRSSDDIKAGEESWQFTYFSPAREMARTATVVGEEITLEPPFETAGQPVPLDTGVWQVNSERVMQIFLENGGYDFINREAELSVIMNLDLATANSQPEWLVSAISTRSGRSLSMWINATSGEIINSAADS